MNTSRSMYELAKKIFPIHRSITGVGVRKTLAILKNENELLKIKSIKSGTKAFDWIVPDEWNITDAYISDLNDKRVIDFKSNNLHIVSYSEPINKTVSLDELKKHLFFLKDKPDLIPYITSYYKRNWGFSLSYDLFKTLKDPYYKVHIGSEFNSSGDLNYGEIIIKGKSKKEVLISTYICHPSMGNNETSGMVVSIFLSNFLKKLKEKNLYFTYRILFIPETIGSIAYLANNNMYKYLKEEVIAGFQVTCVGDNESVSYIKSPMGDTYPDRVVNYYLKKYVGNYQTYSFLDRGSDERQWCSPLINLPVVSLINSKYHEYDEYHTSADNINYISEEGLQKAFTNISNCLIIIENNFKYKTLTFCEPFMSKHNLYPEYSTLNTKTTTSTIMNLIAYMNGERDLLQICEITGIDFFKSLEIVELLLDKGIIEKVI